METLEVNNNDIQFEVDSGCGVTVLCTNLYGEEMYQTYSHVESDLDPIQDTK